MYIGRQNLGFPDLRHCSSIEPPKSDRVSGGLAGPLATVFEIHRNQEHQSSAGQLNRLRLRLHFQWVVIECLQRSSTAIPNLV